MKRAAIILLTSAVSVLTQAETLYVDAGLGGDCAGDYDPTARACGAGADPGFASIERGLAEAQAGDLLLVRGGAYPPLEVLVSGAPGRPIVVRAHDGEQPTLSGSGIGVTMDGRADIVLDGLHVEDVTGFGHIYDSERIVIRNCSFTRASSSGTTGSLKVVRSTHCRIEDNRIEENESDLLILQDASDHNLLQGNTIADAGHSLLSVRCSSHNVIRDNLFRNPRQKAVEIYDCEGTSDAPVRYDDTRRNLFEDNRFVETLATDRDHRYNAIQHGAQGTIVRRNLFRHCLGGGVNYQHYADESLYVYGNRMYHNTLYENRCHAIIGNSGPSDEYFDNVVQNNLLYGNVDCGGGGAQIRIDDPSRVILIGNALADNPPGFVDEGGMDFRLAEGSDHVDAAPFLTTATAEGSGTALPVGDASLFYDGFGIDGEVGDLVQLEQSGGRARVVEVDTDANLLALDRPLSWASGEGCHLAYEGARPDVGAFERGLDDAVAPGPPAALRVSGGR